MRKNPRNWILYFFREINFIKNNFFLGEHTILNNSHGCENVRGKIGDTLVYLNERREFWSTQNPNYGDLPETEIGGNENENVEITNDNVDAQRGRIWNSKIVMKSSIIILLNVAIRIDYIIVIVLL